MGERTAPWGRGLASGHDPVREHLHVVLGVLSRRRLFIVSFVLIVTVAASAIIQHLRPLYEAQTELILQSPSSTGLLPSPLSLLGGGASGYLADQTAVAILSSSSLAEQVIKRLDLMHEPFFASPDGTRAFQWGASPARPARMPSPAAGAVGEPVRDRVLGRYFQHLTVQSAGRSQAITIQFKADRPDLAARVANGVAQAYIADQIASHHRTASREAVWLTEQVEGLKGQLDDAERRLAEFQSAHGVLNASGDTILQRQLADYSQQLTRIQIRRTEISARARMLATLERGAAGGAEASSAALDSPTIQSLLQNISAAERQVADLSMIYRDGYPKLRQARAALAASQARLRVELRRLVEATTNEADLARSQEDLLTGKIASLTAQLQKRAHTTENLRLLEVNLKTTSELYATLLGRLRETKAVDAQASFPQAQVISRALAPDHPVFPKRGRLVGAAAALALLIGVIVAFVLEQLDAGFRNREQIEKITDLETVACIPRVKGDGRFRRFADMVRLLTEDPTFAEAIRYARVFLSLPGLSGGSVRTILITSSLPGEGKTFTSRALAVNFALGGQRVVTLDCDLRKNQAMSRYGDGIRPPGLIDYLAGRSTLDEVLYMDPALGNYHIQRGSSDDVVDPSSALGSAKMRELLRRLAEMFDVVLIDTPPVKLYPDAVVLLPEVDKTLFLLQWAKTRREVGLDAIRTIIQAGHPHPVAALSQVDAAQIPRFDYAAYLPGRQVYERALGPRRQ
jgi:uncharacterized protein involved in exopolysaccharide biosynthesis